jgi:glycosyltransferase involved in cell wall biosynthesis
MYNQPTVSVLTACYNQSQFVVESLESIRNQTYPNIELIIIDDCSTDDSVSIIRDWISRNSVKCRFIAHDKNQGVCKTFNEALSYATGKYISMIAADDVWLPHKTEKQVREMEQLPEDIGVLYTDAIRIDERGNLLPEKFIESLRNFSSMPEGDLFQTLLEKNFIPAMSTLIRKSCYDKVGNYDEKLCYEDYDMWLRISTQYKFKFSPEISTKYRVVSTSMTKKKLHARNCEKLRSDFRMFSKFLRSPRPGGAEQKTIKDHLDDLAEQMYRIDCDARNRYLLTLLRVDLRPFTIAMLLSSVFGLPHERFSRLVS